MRMMLLGFLRQLVLALLVFELRHLAPHGWRAVGAEVGCIEKEREALLRFKAALGENSSLVKWSSWGSKEPKRDCCEWEGVVCNNQTGHVIKLHLPSDFPRFPVKGEMDASLVELQYLMYLNLSSNYFLEQHSIPEFLGSLTHLRYLDLHWCRLSRVNIPVQLGLLSHLQYLDLSGNWLQGAIPYQLGNLSQLQYLDLSYNFFLGGVIPHQLGNLSQLRHLDLSATNLTGSIPYQFGSLSQLRHLDLLATNLTGSIPHQLGNLSQLQYLVLSSNNFLGGAIPHQLGNLSQLRHLDLSETNLTGSIPHQLGNLSNLQKLLLYNAGTLKIYQENGTRHEWLSSLTSLSHLMLGSIIDLKYSHKWLQMIAKLPNLKELIIRDSDLSDEYILSLPSLKFNSSLSKLDLSGNNFESPIVFNWILNISTNLVDLCLFGNQHLEGPIPYEFASMKNSLQNLDLGSNQLKGGLKSIGHMCTLRSLSLGGNLLSSEDLSTILQTFSTTCPRNSLQYLDLSDNHITGTLVSLSIFPSLKNFDISRNILNGTISKDLQFPSSLVSLDIRSNFLKGVLTSSHLANLHNLKSLYLSDNSLTLRFSHNWVPPFQLEAIYVRSCKLGPDFPEWLQTQNNFIELDISNNGISGTIPDWFWGMLTPKLMNLNVSCNNISGTIPNVDIKFTEYPAIFLAANQFEGSLPRFLQNTEALVLSNNNFSELHQFLCSNGSTQQLILLDLSNNQFFGQLPNCWGHFQFLSHVDLSDNSFFGELPTSIGTLQELKALILRNNEFSGDLFITLKNCSSLALLDAGENKISKHISSWNGIQLYELKILILRDNNISGSLLAHLCSLSNLHFLDLSFNNLSGQIPQCFQNFTPMAQRSSSESPDIEQGLYGISFEVEFSYDVSALLMWKGNERIFEHHLLLKGIDLSNNNLVGKIPPELGMLVEMTSLNLSRNKLDGEISQKIGQLTSLDSLDLSRNHLSGSIPSSFTQIDRLAVLDLSYNNLSGKIPTGTQLQSFDMSRYEGNLGLCGKPLEIKCPEDKQRQPQESVNFQADNDSIISKGFYWSAAFGFIFGFWGVFGPVLFNRSWRHMYFKFFNNLADAIYVFVVLNMTKCNRWIRGYLEKLG
ncbi:hypothetical protein K1719_025159 [Acacia pycnantha]|nr:hypothetical protein K1719_025159 [Acacia pycnantha]